MDEEEVNIVDSSESVKTIDKPKAPAKVKAPKEVKIETSFPSMKSRDVGFQEDRNIHRGIDVEKYKNDTNKGNVVFGPGGVDALNNDRADQQSWGTQAMNMLGQAVVGEVIGGTLEGIGYLGEVKNAYDYMSGEEKEWGNWLTELGKDTREFAQDNMAIHQRTDSGMSDSGWWFSNGVSVASSLSMLIPSGAAVKALGMLGKGVSKGLGMMHKSMDVAAKMGKYERWMAEGISQAVVSRHIENSMEASGTFNDQKQSLMGRVNPKTDNFFTEEEATTLASVAASSNYNTGWAMLLQDIPQYLAIGKVFNPVSMKMESKIAEAVNNGAVKGFKGKVLGGLGTFASEGFEESYQYYVAERGKLLSDLKAGLITEKEYDDKLDGKIGDKEMMTSAFWGGLGGNLFQAAGTGTTELFKSKERRNYEENYATIQGDYIKRRGESFELMQTEIAKADQTGDPVRRQAAIDGAGVHMAIEAVDNDKFNEYVEGLQGMTKMSEAEQKAFETKFNMELNPELFSKYVPALIEQANEVRKKYLKHANKYDSNIAAKMASNDHYIESFDNRLKVGAKEIQQIKDSVPNASKLTDHYTERFATKGNMVALKQANSIHEAAMANTTNSDKLKNRQTLIDKNNKTIEKLSAKMDALTKNDPRTKEEKDSDKEIGVGFETSALELITKATEQTLLSDAINLMQKENLKLQTKSFQAELRAKQMKAQVNNLTTVEQVEQAKLNLEADTKTSKEKKAEILIDLEARKVQIALDAKNAEAKAKQAKNKATLAAEAAAKAKQNPAAVPSVNATPINGDHLEDEFSTEEVDIHGSLVKQSDAAKQKKIGTTRNIGIYGATGNKNYTDWMMNGEDKINTPVSISAGTVVYSGAAQPKLVAKAIADFNAGIINDNVYNHLPLKVTIDPQPGDNQTSERSAFLSARLEVTNPKTKFAYETAWANQDFPIRKAFIDEMNANKNKTTATTVSVQYGGKVMAAPAIGGVIPENSITDMQHFKKEYDENFDLKGEKPTLEQMTIVVGQQLMFTNEKGEILDMNKDRHPDYTLRQLHLPNLPGVAGPVVPMKGAVLLNVKKADGTNFPLKLNIKKHSREEAEIIADLLISAVSKEANVSTPLSQLNEEIKLRIMDHMSDALNAMEKQDPSLLDIIDFFTYVSDQTAGKTSELFMSGAWVKFGGSTEKVNTDPKNPNKVAEREALVDFLENRKRRQFSVKLWETGPDYQEYVLSSGLLSTDAVVDGPLFGGKTDIYIKAPESTAKKVVPNNATMLQHTQTTAVPSKSERRKTSDARKIYRDKSTGGKFAATYINTQGKEIQVLRDTEALARQAVTDLYNKEKTQGPATAKTVVTQPVNKTNPAVEKLRDAEKIEKAEIEKTRNKELTSNQFGALDDDQILEINQIYDLKQKELYDRYDKLIRPLLKSKGTQDDMSDLPEQDTSDVKVIVKNKSGKGNHSLIVKDGGKVFEVSNGKELQITNTVLVNKALLKSGVLKYQKIVVGKQVYAATAIGTIVNITPGSPSNGNEITKESPVGKKVMAQYNGKFTGKVNEIGSEDLNEANGEELVIEMLNGKVITDFTVEEQFAINEVPVSRKKEIQAEITAKNKAGIKAAADAFAAAMKGKSPAREMSDEEIDQIYNEFMGVAMLVDAEKVTKFTQAVEIVITNGAGSSSALQRTLKIGYNKAGRFIDIMESMGILGKFEGAKARALLVTDRAEAIKIANDTIGYAVEVYNSKNASEEELTIDDIFGKDDPAESQKVSDPRSLLMGINSLDLSNEIAVKQEQEDLGSLDNVNTSIDVLDNLVEHTSVAEDEDYSEVDNSDVELDFTFSEEDDFSSMLNFDESESGCGI